MIVIPIFSSEERDRIEREIRAQTDRGAAIIGAEYLSNGLLRNISTSCFVLLDDRRNKEIFEGNGPLSSFSARAKIAHALGLIGPHTKDDLDTIRDIRNDFAHEFADEWSFKTTSVADRCRNLWWAKNVPTTIKRQLSKRLGRARSRSRAQYVTAVFLIVDALLANQVAYSLSNAKAPKARQQPLPLP